MEEQASTTISTILVIASSLLAILISIGTAILSYIKLKPDMRNTDSQTEKNRAEVAKSRAEVVEIYSEELRKVKEDQSLERKETRDKMKCLEEEIAGLRKSMTLGEQERKAEQVIYREFISELLLGITKLTGQIQVRGEIPVWVPPTKLPYDK